MSRVSVRRRASVVQTGPLWRYVPMTWTVRVSPCGCSAVLAPDVPHSGAMDVARQMAEIHALYEAWNSPAVDCE